MKKVIFQYRDASNYKCRVEKEMSDKEAEKFPVGREEVTFAEAGVTDDDIELIQKYGRGDDDHTILEVQEVEDI